jgi:hypothetical protein
MAALATEPMTECWHTHNNVGEPVSRARSLRRSVQWTFPSPDDLLHLYVLAREIPEANFRCVIANIYGLTSFWNDEPEWAGPLYLRFAIRAEGKKLYDDAYRLQVRNLKEFMENYRGSFKLSFEPFEPGK